MKFSLTLLLISSSFSALSAIDYSNCAHGSAIGRISNDGKIGPRDGLEKITNRIETKDEVRVTFEGNDPRYGYKETVAFKKDSQGRITGYKNNTDYSKLTKKEKNAIKESEAYKLANGHYPGECISVSGGYVGSGDSYTASRGDCSNVFAFDGNGNTYMIDYDSVNKKNFNEKKMGMSWEDFEELRNAYNKMQDSKKKLAKAYMDLMDSDGWLFPSGEEVSFKLDEKTCAVEKADQLLFNAVNNSTMPNNVFDAKKCAEIMPIIEKESNDLFRCEQKQESLARKIMGIPESTFRVSSNDLKFGHEYPTNDSEVIKNLQLNCMTYDKMYQQSPTRDGGNLSSGATRQ